MRKKNERRRKTKIEEGKNKKSIEEGLKERRNGGRQQKTDNGSIQIEKGK